MRYNSTRDKSVSLSGAEAILQGLSREGGLLVPERVPTLSNDDFDRLLKMSYPERSGFVMSRFLDDYTPEELTSFAREAYGDTKFEGGNAAPLKKLGNEAFLELFRGPTSAFKDVALQMLPRLLSAALEKTGEQRDVCILVATSGDTGKAALEGFRDVPRTKIMVFYPRDGVSDVQKLQMMTQEGENVGVCSVVGNFDDTQTGVKLIFSDKAFAEKLDENGYFLSSANSINWGRLLPQIAYYISAYCDLVNSDDINMGERINFCVPTGNFGNILAGYYAKIMGLPVNKLICASNRNDVLTEFIETGVYNRNREFFTTASPSMDILISSNLERLLYHMAGGDDKLITDYMAKLSDSGRYEVNADIKDAVRSVFECGSCDDERTRKIIGEVFAKTNYLMDTHTAVAYGVYGDYVSRSGDSTPTVVVSTASPFKFSDNVLEALGESGKGNGFELIERLEAAAGFDAPAPLKELRGKSVRFEQCIEKEEMPALVRAFLDM